MKSPLRIEASADGAMATIYLYDEIGPAYWGLIDAASMIGALNEFKKSHVNLRINSPGGDVFEAFAMFNALARHAPGVTVDVDGLAASAASLVMMAGQTRRIAENAFVMIHNAWTIGVGNAAELRKVADTLDQVDGSIVDTYSARTGLSAEEIQPLMDAETWLRGSEAVTKGFADEIGQPLAIAANVGRMKFRNAPRELLPAAPPAEEKKTAAIPRLVELVSVRNRTQRRRSGV